MKKSQGEAKIAARKKLRESEQVLINIVCMLSDDEWGQATQLAVLGMQQESAAGSPPEHQAHLQHCVIWLANVRAARQRHLDARTEYHGDDTGEPTWTE